MSKPGSGGHASSENSNADRRARLRELALETIDLNNDPYFMRNHLGSYECRLCLTLHMNEGSYLAHTQGKRHQQNLKRRAYRLAKQDNSSKPIAKRQRIIPRKTQKIGTPGYKVVKQRDPNTGQLSLLFRIHYTEIEKGLQPRHRFMSTFEQTIEQKDFSQRYQYIIFAAEPYCNVAFKIPNQPIDKDANKLFTHWNEETKDFTFQMHFE
eukprot:CAMPEP_0202714230 /NCGR_PEP_ID=MMETSP1385-20130828/66941_1 /ASSEMBLY_ACC=CAM_ASM_000861 /TAXON_ID=933848 /ORGANISM="Elphidium margaritaceum" /LENGTH=209 /DNA_ID=CAMNT_0049374915 /DNA_START=29 /DNA_END=655 /DNA_ORIENTATION=+